MRLLHTMGFALIASACANVGPFRAVGEDVDAGVASDATVGDAELPDGEVPSGGTSPVLVANVPGMPHGLAVTTGYAYWIQLADATIGRVARTGGVAQAIDGNGYGLSLVARQSNVYWVSNDAIRTASDTAFSVQAPLYSVSSLAAPLAVTATDVLFFERGTGVSSDTLRRLPLAGGSPVTLRANLSSPTAVQVDGSTLYVAANGALERAPLATPTSSSAIANILPARFSVSGSHVCWTHRPDPNTYTVEVWCTTATGSATQIATAPQDVLSLQVTSSAVYWIPQANNGTTKVAGYNFVTNASTTVWTPPAGWHATELATDGVELYWLATDNTSGKLWRRPL